MIKTIFDQSTREELIKRIEKLDENSQALWGKMNVFQMTKHCTIWFEWVLGKHDQTYRQGFLGKIFGKMALRSNTKNSKPIGKGMPAGKAFTILEKEGDVATQKQLLIALVGEFENFSNEKFIHDFFGKMTTDQIGIFAYKHADHHLRQFGA